GFSLALRASFHHLHAQGLEDAGGNTECLVVVECKFKLQGASRAGSFPLPSLSNVRGAEQKRDRGIVKEKLRAERARNQPECIRLHQVFFFLKKLFIDQCLNDKEILSGN